MYISLDDQVFSGHVCYFQCAAADADSTVTDIGDNFFFSVSDDTMVVFNQNPVISRNLNDALEQCGTCAMEGMFRYLIP